MQEDSGDQLWACPAFSLDDDEVSLRSLGHVTFGVWGRIVFFCSCTEIK